MEEFTNRFFEIRCILFASHSQLRYNSLKCTGEFCFSAWVMEEKQIPMIVCGHVCAHRGLVPHTEMAHIFRETDDGLFLISRFWLGKTLKNPLLRKAILTEETARGMSEHCCLEYRNLAEILPVLYDRFA